jgi:hypothetical protein
LDKFRTKRICVLVRGQTLQSSTPGACVSRIHGHMTGEKAAGLVDEGLAEWIFRERITAKGKTIRERAAAIQLIPKRTWRAKVSKGRDGKPMKCMQLVQ